VSCFEVVVDPCSSAATTSWMLGGGVSVSGVINSRLEGVIMTSFMLAAVCEQKMMNTQDLTV